MSILANIPPRPAGDLVDDPDRQGQSRRASLVLYRFRIKRRKLEVALVQTGQLCRWGPDEPYPVGLDERWAALARDPLTHEVFGAYEFFAGPADVLHPTAPGKMLMGKAIEVDRNHLKLGIATHLIRGLRGAGLQIAEDGQYTPAGAGLANKMAARLKPIPAGAITLGWPPRGLAEPAYSKVAIPLAATAAAGIVAFLFFRRK